MKKVVSILFLLLFFIITAMGCNDKIAAGKPEPIAKRIHVVTDLAHEFSFYADNRFHQQYLPDQGHATNWCNLWNFDFNNANLLVLLSCDDRIEYLKRDIEVIRKFLDDGGGVVVTGEIGKLSQNKLLKEFGAQFLSIASYPLVAAGDYIDCKVEGSNASVLTLDDPSIWKPIVTDSKNKMVMASRKVGKGTLLVSTRQLAGSNPDASDSINKEIWQSLLKVVAGGKIVDKALPFHSRGVEQLEYVEDHSVFKLSYNDYLKPFAKSMVDIYIRSLPFIERRMGVPLSPGMASHLTLLATGGGGFSSGDVVALAVWWDDFPNREDSMIEFLTHESVHSWVLPFPEVWNEPIATYIGNLVMIDMGHEAEALKRIQGTINRAAKLDGYWKHYDLEGNLTGEGKVLNSWQKNDMHWGKSYWIFEEMRQEKPDVWVNYFKVKRAYSSKITKCDIHNTVAFLSMAMGRDLFSWFNQHGIPCNKDKAQIQLLF
ncbi:MAG: hypothetical protein ACWA6U_13730 [Breznakibacter sp.]